MTLGKRIAIIGNAGGGKTVLARRLGDLLDLPVVHVDSVQYQPHWGRTAVDECDQALDRAARDDRWVIDGFGSDEVIERRVRVADTVVFINFPLWRHYWWTAKRQWRARGGQRSELPENCPEFTFAYTKKLVTMMWRVHKAYRPWFRQLVEAKRKNGNVVDILSPTEWARFVEEAAGTTGHKV